MSRASELGNQHLALLVTSVTTLVFLLKILVAAHYDVTTALAIVRAAPSTTLLLGLAIALVPAAIAGAIGFTLGIVATLWAVRSVSVGWLALLLVLLYVAVVAVPVAILIGLLIMAALVLLPVALSTRRSSERQLMSSTAAGRAILLVAPVFLVITIVTPDPWPAERLEMVRGQPIVAFVLEDDGDWWTLLRETDRVVVQINGNTIRDRAVCKPPSDSWLPDWMHVSLPQITNPSRAKAC